MESTITIKRSPIVLIRNLIGIEVLALLAYFLSTGHGSYKSEFYSRLFFADMVPYDMAKLVFLSAFQLCITIYAFLSWYYENYDIGPDAIAHIRGVFFKKVTSFRLERPVTADFRSELVGKLLHFGSIRVRNHRGETMVLATISRPWNYLEIIQSPAKPDIAHMFGRGEDETLEFKSSLRFDHKAGKLNRDLERAAMKTVAAFLNSNGGHLVIGVDDRGTPTGLHKDYETLQRKDKDGFENHFTQVFNAMVGPGSRRLVKLWFYELQGHEACVVQVAASPRPVYLRTNESEHFYVRTGNTTTDLRFSEVEAYARSQWPRLTA